MSQREKTAGILGGMGPAATVDFLARVVELTPAEKDQDHIRLIVDQNPKVPNRQSAILGDGENPAPALLAMARGLQAAGADFLVIPCNSAYAFADAIHGAVDIPLISIVDVAVEAAAGHGVSAVGVLATDGCLASGIYQQALEGAGLRAVLPDDGQVGTLMTLIGRIKAGDTSAAIVSGMQALAAGLAGRGAEVIISGCTEIPLVLGQNAVDVPLISSTDELARRTIELVREM